MLVYINTNIGILTGEIVEERQNEYDVKINNDIIVINKNVCTKLDDESLDFLDYDDDEMPQDDYEVESYEYNPELEADLIETNNVKEGNCMSLKERILEKLNYKRIAEEVYNILEKEIESDVLSQIDESDIAEKFAQEYSDSFIEYAGSIIIDSVISDIEYSAIEEEFNDVVTNNLY